MGIEDIQISEELETNAPSIKYSGNEGPKSPQEMEQMIMASLEEEYAKYVFEMEEQGLEPMSMQRFIEQAMAEGQMSGGQPLPQDPTKPVNPFQPKPTGPVLPDRQMAAYGGIMGLDGRKKYGIGSWFQEKIMDPIKKNPKIAAAAALYGLDTFEVPGVPGTGGGKINEGIGNIFEVLNKKPDPVLERDTQGRVVIDPKTGKPMYKQGSSVLGNITSGLTKNLIPVIGGLGAGIFTKSQQGAGGGQDASTFGQANDQTAMNLKNYTQGLNVLDEKQMMAAGQNFALPDAARKYTPAEMIETYAQAAANGGRIGYDEGNAVIDYENDTEYRGWKSLYEVNKDVAAMSPKHKEYENYYISQQNMKAEGGIMDLGGMEKDYRAEGGFVPIGKQEKADDVPARLSVNEFVFTADAVRNAGGGDIDQGAQVMENMMKHLEQGGQVSEESQGMQGARDMFATSQRLGEVV
jgi:hypothetical protein